jgi:hypothetical protein
MGAFARLQMVLMKRNSTEYRVMSNESRTIPYEAIERQRIISSVLITRYSVLKIRLAVFGAFEAGGGGKR